MWGQNYDPKVRVHHENILYAIRDFVPNQIFVDEHWRDMKNPNRQCNFTASFDQGYHFGYAQVHSLPSENARRLNAFVQEIDAFLVKMVALISIVYDPWVVLGYERPKYTQPSDTSAVVPKRPIYTTRPSPTATAGSANDPPPSGGVVITPGPGGVVTASHPHVQDAAAAGLDDQDVQHASVS